MPMSFKQLREQYGRPAVVMELGGFRPPDDPATSWFGRVNLALPGEGWPESNGRPMLALAQLNLLELPWRPPRLDDLEMLTVFVDAEELPLDTPNGEGWALRAYPRLADLVPLAPVKSAAHVKALAMRPHLLEQDCPCWDDVVEAIPAALADGFEEHVPNADGFKLGGWPSLIQSEIYWAPHNQHPAAPEYVFQIDATEKGQWAWGDGGAGYFGRGTAPGQEHEWVLAWQCY